jgi:thiamine-phosphate pyrophosphorylase
MPFVLSHLYPILDAHFFPADPAALAGFLDTTVRDLADNGVTLLQLRMKRASRDQVLAAAETIRAAAPASMRLMLNDYADLARVVGFDGVHLGQGDLSIAQARALLGPEAILGISTHSIRQAEEQANGLADYIATGPVFATGSKPDAEPVIGFEGVRAVREVTAKPLVAIGGITLANVQSVWDAGADSVAVISALFAPGKTPGRLAGDFLKLFR